MATRPPSSAVSVDNQR